MQAAREQVLKRLREEIEKKPFAQAPEPPWVPCRLRSFFIYDD
jgi:hypothetical protein